MGIKFLTAIVLIAALAAPVFAQAKGIDPSGYTPSARVLGLGRAYVGLADDAAGMYINPAGMAKATDWKLTSMSGKFVEDYDYISVTGIYPTNYGVIGLGYDVYSIAGAPATTLDATSNPNDPVYMIDPNQTSISNFNAVMFLSYATELKRFLKYPQFQGFIDNLSLGANLRLYSAGLSGDHISNGSATGMDADLGAMYKAAPWLSLGGNVQNVLPYTMGGKLTYAGGHSESYPAKLKLGTAMNILGETDSFRTLGQHKLTGLFDLDYYPGFSSWPMVYHFGLEYSPLQMIALRVGLDQSAMGNGSGGYETATDLCFGVGFNYTGFSFDYAYHQYAAFPGVDNHSFSFSYAPVPKKKEVQQKLLNIEAPKDKTLTFKESAELKLKLTDIKKAQYISLNEQNLPISLNGDVTSTQPLTIGRNKMTIRALDRLKLTLETENLRLLRLVTFPDVPEGYWSREQISMVNMLNIVTGYPDGKFKPEGNITRAEMAALLMRAKGNEGLGTGVPKRFKDVKPNHWASSFIIRAAAQGVVEGYPGGWFKPSGNITRAEGLAMIARFAKVTQEAYTYQYFPDVMGNFWASQIIAGASKAGILDFIKGQPFQPKRKLTRAEAVEMLYRTSFVKDLLSKDLLNWESY